MQRKIKRAAVVVVILATSACAGRQRRSVETVPPPAPPQAAVKATPEQIVATIVGMSEADAAAPTSGFVYTLHCTGGTATGTRIAEADGVQVDFPGTAAPDGDHCRLEIASATAATKPVYRSAAVVVEARRASITVEAVGDRDEDPPGDEDLEVSTTEGGGCRRFDVATYECAD